MVMWVGRCPHQNCHRHSCFQWNMVVECLEIVMVVVLVEDLLSILVNLVVLVMVHLEVQI